MLNTETGKLALAQQFSAHGRQQEDGVLAIRAIAMPADTNPAGDIFGGWLMSQMDLAAGNMAGRVSQGRSATVAVEAMQFLHPVKVGDEVTLYASLKMVGRTSMRVHVDVWARNRFAKEGQKVTNADFVFVALDEDGNPREIPAT
ncbi:acyl-CoA thioesterase [Pelagimonas varians]|uniref:Putative acyl-CoA thioester hydrolase n=1 Tax=Pelagimonas varians TaxID=696760 RepID=A0A238KUY8_9RHOB|nr:acyl-CoA thioesterase [Pelagimonas varians]PYG32538.1 (3S)-malyl-CoA thioesterase [Pelagimonas varians]SMX45856.1 putative acyl-CoA thioester hydrolase [Pelagimonas varians]